MLLSLSAAFDTMERDILIQRLHGSVGLTGGLMVGSHHTEDLRGFCVSISGLIFAQIKIQSGVPQGSILWVHYSLTFTCSHLVRIITYPTLLVHIILISFPLMI